MECSLTPHLAKVAIIGAGNVGTAAAYALMMDDVVTEIVLVDSDRQRAEGEALDLEHGIQFSTAHSIQGTDSYELVRDAQVVVVTAGKNQRPGQTRMELFEENAQLLSIIIPQIIRYNADCIILVVSNPVDLMTYAAWKFSGLPAARIIGSGTELDSARLRSEISNRVGVSAKDIIAYVVGEHGDHEFVCWSNATVAGFPLNDFEGWDDSYKQLIEDSVKSAAYKIIEKKGMTNFAIGLVIAKVIRALLTNQTRIFSLSTVIERMGRKTVLSTPTIVNKCGVVRSLSLPLHADEQERLDAAQKVLNDGIDLLCKKFSWDR